jgi:MFS superfamily sulfate permease-like transporter
MAFAIASGARPEQGLYTAIVGGACVSLLGGSRVQIAGPTGQWRDFLGLPPIHAEHFHERLWRLIEAMPQLNWPTAAPGTASRARPRTAPPGGAAL